MWFSVHTIGEILAKAFGGRLAKREVYQS